MWEAVSAMGMGLLAGLGVAMPLGAIGILLIHEGVSAGIRRGLPAAVGVASVDGLYALASVVAGTIVAPEVRRLGALPEVLGGVVLIVIAVTGHPTSIPDSDDGLAESADPNRPPIPGVLRLDRDQPGDLRLLLCSGGLHRPAASRGADRICRRGHRGLAELAVRTGDRGCATRIQSGFSTPARADDHGGSRCRSPGRCVGHGGYVSRMTAGPSARRN